jgi:parallel beta-helix repeat protein
MKSPAGKRILVFMGAGKLIPPGAAVAALAALAVAGSGHARAGETTVSCGETLKASVRLANDLSDCPGTGLIIGADNITVDLNGHTIDGTNRKEGIANEKHANVTIVNGTIRDFHAGGVNVSGARGVVLRKLTVRKIGVGGKPQEVNAGFVLFNCPRARITDNVLSNHVRVAGAAVNGLDVYGSPGARVERNRFDRNVGDGISVFGSPRSRLIGNRLEGNGRNGIHLNSGSDSTWVTGNQARGNRSAGIAIGALRNGRVLGNTVSGNGEVGLLLFDLSGTTIRGNRARGNANGIVLYAGQAGVAQYGGKHGSRHNRLVANSTRNNARAGIRVRGDGGKDRADDNLVAGNVANGNGRDGGIVVEGKATGNRLRGNTANGNVGHGIAAVRGTIDGGGNRAHGNRRRPQCVRVSCS